MRSRIKLILKRILIVAVWLLVWQAASVLTGLEILLASPVNVFLALVKMLGTKIFYITLANSFVKITLGFLAAFAAGTILGLLSGKYGIIEEVLRPPVQLMKTLPITSFIILLLIWFGSENVAVFIAFIVIFPMIYIGVIDGVRKGDVQLKEMAEVFGIPAFRKIRCIYIPQIVPFVEANLKTGIGMCWKAGVSAEVIGLVRYSVGEQLYYSKLYLMTAELFAWSIVVVFVSMVFEVLFIKLMELVVDVLKHPGRAEDRTEDKVEDRTEGEAEDRVEDKVEDRVEDRAEGETTEMAVSSKLWDTNTANAAETKGAAGDENRIIKERNGVSSGTVRISGVNKCYGNNQVLRDFSIEIPKGSVCCIMGESGAGKTTLLRIVMGLENPDTGKVEGTGKISAVFQEDRLVNWLTTIENIRLVLKRKEYDHVREYLCQLLPLKCINQKTEELSGGMKRRAAVVRAMMSDCDTICMDEPFTGLDDENRALVREYILRNQNGRTILLVTHSREDAEALKAQICLLTSH